MIGGTIAHGGGIGITRSFDRADLQSGSALESAPCPNCECRQFHSVLEIPNPLTCAGGTFSLIRCAACSLMLTNPRPTIEALRSFYSEGHAYCDRVITNIRRWRWLEHLALRSHFGYPPQPASLLAKMLSNLAMWKFHSRLKRRDWIPFRAPGRLLDIGSGMPFFQDRMQSFGWTVTGIDVIHETDGRQLPPTDQEKTGQRQPLSDLQPESFDAVTMWHVLQQNPNPSQLVRQASSLLCPGGLIVIEVPNIESLTFAEFRQHWFGLEMPRHLQHFCPKSLSRVLPTDQLRIIEIQQIGMRSWIKRSAERAVAAGNIEYEAWLKRGKSFWDEKALRSEIANQADGVRIIAERRS
jgi:2-polyprenyl-3-methyl-5-hydroxy-6-metoxy-1,4-benzoquinol methylase